MVANSTASYNNCYALAKQKAAAAAVERQEDKKQILILMGARYERRKIIFTVLYLWMNNGRAFSVTPQGQQV
jgi:hypothetical protein